MSFVNTSLEKMKNPVVAALVAVIFGFIFGLVWGWVIQPTQWKDAAPDLLHEEFQREYLRMTIDSFTVNSDTAKATSRWNSLGDAAQLRLAEISSAPDTQDKATIDAFGQIMPINPVPAGGL